MSWLASFIRYRLYQHHLKEVLRQAERDHLAETVRPRQRAALDRFAQRIAAFLEELPLPVVPASEEKEVIKRRYQP